MDLRSAMWENWRSWSSGGVDMAAGVGALSGEAVRCLRDWAETATGNLSKAQSLKSLMDIATWCAYGTHTLPFLPYELRQLRIDQAAGRLHIEAETLRKFLAHSGNLPVVV